MLALPVRPVTCLDHWRLPARRFPGRRAGSCRIRARAASSVRQRDGARRRSCRTIAPGSPEHARSPTQSACTAALTARLGRYARIMGKSYLMSRRWALTDRFAITDENGTPQFEVQGRFALSKQLSVRDSAGAEVAVISRRGLSPRFEILAGGQLATVRPRGFLGQRFEIDSAAGPLEARGNFSGRQYSVTRGGVQAASVTQMRALRERFAIEITD